MEYWDDFDRDAWEYINKYIKDLFKRYSGEELIDRLAIFTYKMHQG